MNGAVTVKTVLTTAFTAVVAAATAWKLARLIDSPAAATPTLQQLQADLAHEQEKRAADRAGRIRAEQKLKQLNLQLAQLTSVAQVSAACAGAADIHSAEGGSQQPSSSALQQQIDVYPFAPIGVLRSCFNDRRGTPRQPRLVPAARAALRLAHGVPSVCLRGLEGFSHCWVLYVFHENTDLAKLLAGRASISTGSNGSSAGSSHIKALISVPRLNGGKMGVLATRSPHRPVPIGLSTAEIVSVDAANGVLVLGGVDIVDGSPVLDVKPYVPFSDAMPDATAPDWVAAAADEEPLALSGVTISTEAAQAITNAWKAVRHKSLYSSAQQLLDLVQQVLSRDIRSLHQRRDVAPVTMQQPQQTGVQQQDSNQHQEHELLLSQQPDAGAVRQLQYSVTLDGVDISYTISDSGHVTVLGAAASNV